MVKSVQDEAIIFNMMQQGPFPGLKPKQILFLINYLHLTLHMQVLVHKDLLTPEDPWLNSTHEEQFILQIHQKVFPEGSLQRECHLL